MSDLNQVTITGRAGGDAKAGTSQAGKGYARVNIAVNDDYKDKDGAWQKKTVWVPCVAFGHLAEKFAEVKKGDRLLVHGKLEVREYEKDGQKRTDTSVIAQSFEWLWVPEKPAAKAEAEDEDIPF